MSKILNGISLSVSLTSASIGIPQLKKRFAIGPRAKTARLKEIAEKILDPRNCGGSVQYGEERFDYVNISVALTLADLLDAENDPMQAAIIENLKLKKSIEKINRVFNFFERLKVSNREILESISLYSLLLVQTPLFSKKPTVADALMDEEMLLNIKLKDLGKMRDIKLFAFRLDQIERERPDLLNRHRSIPFNGGSPLEITLGKLRTLSEDEIRRVAGDLRKSMIPLLAERQQSAIDVSSYSISQICEWYS